MKKFHGSCHCGSVKFSFEEEDITSGMRCTCSYCERRGSALSKFTLSKDDLNIKAKDDAMGMYQFDTKIAKHFFCHSCGIHPFLETVRAPGQFRVNLGCLDGIDVDKLEIVLFDGKNLL
jgi:hypothetical protein